MKHSYLLFILLFFSCNKNVIIQPFSIEQIEDLSSFDDLSIKEYLKLAASIEQLEVIFSNRNMDYVIFKEFFLLGISEPILIVDGSKNFTSWISESELDWMKSMKSSDQKCVRIINSYSSRLDPSYSEIGKEIKFILELYSGESYMDSTQL